MNDPFLTENRALRWRTYLVTAVRVLIALVFLASGGAKLAGATELISVFEKVGAGQWFRYVTGALEILGAILIALPATVFWGASLLACIMVGATFTHLVLIGGNPLPAIFLLLITAAFAWSYRNRDGLK